MAKKGKEKVEVSFNGKMIDMSAINELIRDKDYEITGATLEDDFCKYDFKTTSGHLEGETGGHKGPLIVTDDLRAAFHRLRVHLACMDDAFVMLDFNSIDEQREDPTTDKYDVTSFKIKGADENIKVSLMGSKYLSSISGRMSVSTPLVLLDHGTDYKWWNELLEDIRKCQREVAYYKEGKGMRPEEPEEKPKAKQAKITDPDQQLQDEQA